MKTRQYRIALAVSLFPSLVLLIWAAVQMPAIGGGDPISAYFPTVQNIWAGSPLKGFAAMTIGAGRLPGYPLALAFASLISDDLVRASQMVGIAGATITLAVVALMLRSYALPWLFIPCVLLAIATQTTFVSAATTALPDMWTLGFIGLTAHFLSSALQCRDEAICRWFVLAGCCAGAAFLCRLNAATLIFLGPVAVWWLRYQGLWVATKWYTLGFAGVAALTLPFTIALASIRERFPRISLGKGMAVRPSDTSADSTLSALLQSLEDGILDLPSRLSSNVPWGIPLLAIAVILFATLRKRDRNASILGVLLLLMLGGLLPIHYEARYYLLLVPILYGAAAVGAWKLTHLLPTVLRSCLVATIAIGIVLVQFTPVLTLAESSQRLEAEIKEMCATLDSIASETGQNPLGAVEK